MKNLIEINKCLSIHNISTALVCYNELHLYRVVLIKCVYVILNYFFTLHLSSNIQKDFEELYGWQDPPMNPEGWIVRHWQGDDLEFSEGELFQDFEQTFQNFFEGFPFDVTPQIQGLMFL